jgi:peptide/nickel transport system permease protein
MEIEEGHMKRYLAKRILLLIPTFIGISLITYLIVRLAPGDYTSIRAGLEGELKSGAIGKEILAQERKLYGLDKPIPLGYAEWLWSFIRLDFGVSRKDGRRVSERIAEALPVTLALNLIAVFIGYIISIPLGIYTSARKDSNFDRITGLILFFLYSLPHFWVSLLLLKYLAGGEYLNLFPLSGIRSEGAEGLSIFGRIIDYLWHLALPIAVYVYGEFAYLSRYTRANMLEVINQQYIMTARAKGLTERRIIFVHAFRNSLIPLVTLMASLLPGLLGGSVIVESIFSIPGMGLMAFDSIESRDIPVIMAITLVSLLITDISYALADPRIRLEARA